MPLSHYLVTTPLPDDPDRLLLYSTHRASLAILDTATLRRLEQGEPPTATLASHLERLGLWVEDLGREREIVFTLLDQVNAAREKVTISIIPGMACNFACRYCYEGELKSPEVMGDETVDQAVRFIASRAAELGAKQLILNFYGGEPLLYPGHIRRFATLLKPLLAEQGIGFGFTLVTNGSLLTAEAVIELLPMGLLGARVTVDGPAANHDRFRPFRNGSPSFTTIINNLKAVCGMTKIDVGGNFTSDNYHSFPQLLDHLLAEGLGPDRLGQVSFSAAMRVGDSISRTGFSEGCASVNEPWHAEAVVMLQEAIQGRGFKVGKVSPSPCMVDIDDALVIHHDGGLYKCPALIGHERFKAGDIRQGMASDWAAVHSRGHWRHQERCLECVYLPLCFGGCRYSAYQREGGMERVDCQEEYFRLALPGLLLQELRSKLGAK